VKKVLVAWGIWLAWIVLTFQFAQWIPYTLFGILLIGVPIIFCVLIFLGQQKLRLWANILLLIVQGAAALPLTMYVALIFGTYSPRHYDCGLPFLESEIPSSTIAAVDNVTLTDACPIPVASELEFVREYGAIRMKLRTISRADSKYDSVQIAAQTADGQPLKISGSRVQEYGDYSGPLLLGQKPVVLNLGWGESPGTFLIDVIQQNGDVIERLEFEYVRRRCTCLSYGI